MCSAGVGVGCEWVGVGRFPFVVVKQIHLVANLYRSYSLGQLSPDNALAMRVDPATADAARAGSLWNGDWGVEARRAMRWLGDMGWSSGSPGAAAAADGDATRPPRPLTRNAVGERVAASGDPRCTANTSRTAHADTAPTTKHTAHTQHTAQPYTQPYTSQHTHTYTQRESPSVHHLPLSGETVYVPSRVPTLGSAATATRAQARRHVQPPRAQPQPQYHGAPQLGDL